MRTCLWYLVVAFNCVTVLAQSNSHQNNFVRWELEYGSLGLNLQSDNTLLVTAIPTYLRTIPSHLDDPPLTLGPLPDESPTGTHFRRLLTNWLTAKVWLYSTLGFGIGLRGLGLEFSEDPIFGLYKYNYAENYGNWGAAYIQYYFATRPTDYGKHWRWLRLCAELKTPLMELAKNDERLLRAGLFVGYEPQFYEAKVYVINGWDRWNAYQTYQEYELGTLRVTGAIYAGFNIQRNLGDPGLDWGLRLYAMKHFMSYHTASTNQSVAITAGSTPIIYYLGVYIIGSSK